MPIIESRVVSVIVCTDIFASRDVIDVSMFQRSMTGI